MRKVLDRLYQFSGTLAAALIVGIVAIVFAQVCLNFTDKILVATTGNPLGLTIPSYSDFTGYFLAASSFLALAYTLRVGGHIRVTLITRLLGARTTACFEGLTLALALVITTFATYYVFLLISESYAYGDKSPGMIPVPLWLPQTPVALGLLILSIALLDDLAGVIRGKQPSYHGREENLMSEE